MSITINQLAKEFQQVMDDKNSRKTSPIDTQAEVVEVDEDVIWVHFPGGIEKTPVAKTISAKKGDIVQVRAADGKAWITGNSTSPPTDDTVATEADTKATQAIIIGEMAIDDAVRAKTAADAAEESASEAASAATTASSMANTAQYNLSEIERVVDAVNWIAQHGVYVITEDREVVGGKFYFSFESASLTTDTTVDRTKAYYTLSNGVYTYVENPTQEGLVNYYIVIFMNVSVSGDPTGLYELKDVSSSISNYVASHISLDANGLVIQTDGVDSKVRISGGGVLLTNEQGNVIATFSSTVTLGDTSGAHVTLSPNNGLEFWNGMDRVAYVNSETLMITQAEITNSLRIGKFEWRTQGTNRISLVYVP